jgi:peptidoglycan-N-acetylglucosamine deacetylase
MLTSRNVNIAFLLAIIVLMLCDNYSEIPLLPYILLLILYFFLQAYGSIVLRAQFFVPVLSSGDRRSKDVAITFDDGPIVGKTEKILDILKSFQAPAAFFCIGNRVNEHQAIVSRIHQDGHLIGNHSYWHGKMFDIQTPQAISKELDNTDEIIRRVVNVKPNFFRPPYGVTNPMVAAAIRQGHYKTIGWSTRSMDTVTKDPGKLFKRVTASLKGGDIILFHDFCDSSIEILPALIEHIRENGFKIVRLDTLLNEKAYA